MGFVGDVEEGCLSRSAGRLWLPSLRRGGASRRVFVVPEFFLQPAVQSRGVLRIGEMGVQAIDPARDGREWQLVGPVDRIQRGHAVFLVGVLGIERPDLFPVIGRPLVLARTLSMKRRSL